MELYKKLLFTLFLASIAIVVKASTNDFYYTIQLGAFVAPQKSDFNHIKHLGFLYTTPLNNNLTRVYIGGYPEESDAIPTLVEVQAKGYPDAFVTRKKLGNQNKTYSIYLGSRPFNANIDWKMYNKAGKLYAVVHPRTIDIYAGQMNEESEAAQTLVAVQKLGFYDAKAVSVSRSQLQGLSIFETGVPIKNIVLNPITKVVEIPEVVTEKGITKTAPDLMVRRPSTPSNYQHTSSRISSEFSAKGRTPINRTSKKTQNNKVEGSSLIKRTNNGKIIPNTYKVSNAKKEEFSAKGGSIPQAYNYTPKSNKAANLTNFKVVKAFDNPNINAKVKRTSAYNLQILLKEQKYYKGSLDGFYGEGTAIAWKQMLTNNPIFKKIYATSQCEANLQPKGTSNILQNYINTLRTNSAVAINGLQTEKSPIARAYHAYYLFELGGNQDQVNQLMNQALKQAFSNKRLQNKAKFNYTAGYNYTDINLLVEHLAHIHSVTPEVKVPNWLFFTHPTVAKKAFQSGNYNFDSTDDLLDWTDIELLRKIRDNISATSPNQKEIVEANAQRTSVLLCLNRPSSDQYIQAKKWNKTFLTNIDSWGKKAALLKEWSIPFKASYLEAQVKLEDYFMQEGYTSRQATTASIQVLQTMVEPYLKDIL